MKHLFKKFYVLLALSSFAINLLTVGAYAENPNNEGEATPYSFAEKVEIY